MIYFSLVYFDDDVIVNGEDDIEISA